jgi:hypothetical protein
MSHIQSHEDIFGDTASFIFSAMDVLAQRILVRWRGGY